MNEFSQVKSSSVSDHEACLERKMTNAVGKGDVILVIIILGSRTHLFSKVFDIRMVCNREVVVAEEKEEKVEVEDEVRMLDSLICCLADYSSDLGDERKGEGTEMDRDIVSFSAAFISDFHRLSRE